jgi:hypothetical protein
MATSFSSSLDRLVVRRFSQDGKNSRTTSEKSFKNSQAGWISVPVKASCAVKCKAGPDYGIEKMQMPHTVCLDLVLLDLDHG